MNQRPDSFTVDYKGTPLLFARRDDGSGYTYQWPPDGAYHWIDTESGTRHKLAFDEQGRATIIGSLAHADWHVVITDGVARDVGR